MNMGGGLLPVSQVAAVLRFHFRTGGRLVQRVFLPLIAVMLFLSVFLGTEFLTQFTAALVGGGYFSAAVPTTVFVLIVFKIASRRMTAGLPGWTNHLPVSGNTIKISLIIAMLTATLPLLSILAALSAAAGIKYGINIYPYLAGLPLAGMAGALFTLPVRRKYPARSLAVTACLCFLSGNWILLCAGVVVFMGAYLVAGPLLAVQKKTRHSAKGLFHFIMQWRSLRLRILLPYLLSFLTLPCLFLVLNNNANDSHQSDMLIRLACGMNLMVFCAFYCQILASRRPPWAWSRSLPVSAKQRILNDALCILGYIAPLMVFAGMVRFRMIPFFLCCVPGLVFLSLAANRRVAENRFGVSGQILGQTFLPLLLFGISAWMSLLYLILTPRLFSGAVFADMSLPLSRWEAIHHLSEGDSQAWTGN